MLEAHTQRSQAIAQALERGRRIDPIGHQIHTLLAMVYLFALPLATAPKEIAFCLLAVWACVRLPHTWPSYRLMLGTPVLLAMLAWSAWQALSFTWSGNPVQGWDEYGSHRVLFMPLMLWPVLDRLPWLIGAALLGVLGENVTQAAQHLHLFGLDSTNRQRLPGLIHPGKSAAWCVAAMAWYLSALLHARGWLRWVSIVLLAAATAGLLATASRASWLAAAIVVPVGLILIAVRRPRTRRAALTFAAAGVLAAWGIWLIAGPNIHARVGQAFKESRDAQQRGVYWTSSGLRLALWSWAWEIFRSAPITGVGVGDFGNACQGLPSFEQAREDAARASFQERVPGYAKALAERKDVKSLRGYERGKRLADERVRYITRDHAHSTYLHTLAQLGLVGGLVLALMLWLALCQCRRDPPDHPYADGNLFVLLSWLIAAQFDCYELNAHQLGLLAFVVAATLPDRAAIRLTWRAVDSPATDNCAAVPRPPVIQESLPSS